MWGLQLKMTHLCHRHAKWHKWRWEHLAPHCSSRDMYAHVTWNKLLYAHGWNAGWNNRVHASCCTSSVSDEDSYVCSAWVTRHIPHSSPAHDIVNCFLPLTSHTNLCVKCIVLLNKDRFDTDVEEVYITIWELPKCSSQWHLLSLWHWD